MKLALALLALAGVYSGSNGTCLTLFGDTCSFPFVYEFRTYNTCTTAHGRFGDQPWCGFTDMFGMEAGDPCAPGCPGVNETTVEVNVNPLNAVGECNCGVLNNSTATRIAGGEETEAGEYPWQVAILHGTQDPTWQSCAGTLVSDRHVVTGARCAAQDPSNLYVVVGETNLALASDTQRFIMAVAAIKRHPGFSYNYITIEHDISVLELSDAVDLVSFPHIKPACLPYSSQINDFVGQSAVVTGWGDQGGDSPSAIWTSHLHEISVEVYGNSNCGDTTDGTTPGMFCAGAMEGGKNHCMGDDGGPLVASDPNNNGAMTLIGVASISKSVRCEDANAPGLYADVPYYMQDGWLMQQLTDLNTCHAPGQAPTTTTTNPPATTTTTTVSCPKKTKSYPKLTVIKTVKRTKNSTACKTLCENNIDCDYWSFLPNNKVAKRRCRLFHVTFKRNDKWTSGELTTC